MKVDLTEMCCDVGMDKGSLLCAVMRLHLHEVTVSVDVYASLNVYLCR
jgi:hypothetical protein